MEEMNVMNLQDDCLPLGDGSSGSYSRSYTYVYQGDTGGKTIEYQSQTERAKRPGTEEVTETNRSYKDSSGYHKMGISRTLGNQGRKLTRERSPDGRESSNIEVREFLSPTLPPRFPPNFVSSETHYRPSLTSQARHVDNPSAFEEAWQARANELGLGGRGTPALEGENRHGQSGSSLPGPRTRNSNVLSGTSRSNRSRRNSGHGEREVPGVTPGRHRSDPSLARDYARREARRASL